MRGPQIPGERQDPPRGERRRRGLAELEHPLQASDVVHLKRKAQGARLIDATRSEAPHQAEQRIDAPHPGPGQRAVEQDGREAADARAVGVGLRLQGLHIP